MWQRLNTVRYWHSLVLTMSDSSRIILTDIFGEYASSNEVNWEDWDQLEVQPDGRVGRSQRRNTRSNRSTVILTDPDGEASEVNWEDWDQVAITSSGTVVSPNYDASSSRRNRANPTNSVVITDHKGEF